MKSKRAVELIKKCGLCGEDILSRRILPSKIKEIVELAEEDARERTKQAFCSFWWLDHGTLCMQCKGEACFALNEFLTHYDK